MFQTNTQGFVIIDLNKNSKHWMKSTDACMQFDFLGYKISVSTGGSVLRGGCIVEHLVTDPEGREYEIAGSVQDAIMFVCQREMNGSNSNALTNALSQEVEVR